MLRLINNKFSVSVQAREESEACSLEIFCRPIKGKKCVSFSYQGTVALGGALDNAIEQAAEQFEDLEPANVLQCLASHFEQYANTLYSYSISYGMANTDWTLGVLEFYIQRFSLEMAGFLGRLSVSELENIDVVFLNEIPWDHPDYSELLEAKKFYLLWKSLNEA